LRFRRHASRVAEVAAALIRHGWHPALRYLGLDRFRRRDQSEDETALPASSLRAMLSELGPTYVKVGQLLSTRPDLIPPAYVEELEKLQDQGEPIPLDQVRAVLREELGDPDEAFEDFDPQPLAAASLGQVHRARLRGVGAVIVKVQRPGAREVVETDLEILFQLARALQAASSRARRIDVVSVVEDVASLLRSELDYTAEGRNADRLRSQLAPGAPVRIPKVHWEHTTRRVLVMECLTGCKVTDLGALRAMGLSPERIAEHLASVLLRQIFIDGVFHGDPHPGNVQAFRDGSIGFVDFGVVGHLDGASRKRLLEMLTAIYRGEGEAFAEHLLALCYRNEHVNRTAFSQDAEAVVREFLALPPEEGRLSVALRNALRIVLKHSLSLPPAVPLLVRCVVSFEGVCKALDPDFEILDLAARMLFEAAASRLNPRSLGVSAMLAGADAVDLLLNSPRMVNDILSKMATGRISVNVEHRGLRDFADRLDKIANRLAYALMVAAALLSSSMLIQLNEGPTFYGLPIVGLAAFVLCFVLGVELLWTILRSGKLR